MQLQFMRPAAIHVILLQHFMTFAVMVAAGRRAGNGCVAIGWRVENAKSCASFCKGLCNPFVKHLGRLCVVHVHLSVSRGLM